MEHILLVLDPARQEGELVEKDVQVNLIVDVIEIGFAVDNVNLILKQGAVLHRMVFPVALRLPDHRLDLLALGTGELTLCRSFCLFSQSASPPVPVGIAAPGRNRDCWSGRCAPSVG